MKESFIPFFLSSYVSEVTGYMVEKYGLEEKTAMRKFLFSEACRMLEDPELEMWEFCPKVLFEMWESEQITGDPRNSSYIRGE